MSSEKVVPLRLNILTAIQRAMAGGQRAIEDFEAFPDLQQRERNSVRAGVHAYPVPIIQKDTPELAAVRAAANADRTFWRSKNDGPPEPWSPSFMNRRRPK